MVYHGPSRGCHMCRKRRIKCDEARPACRRCIKTRRVCPGYRQELELDVLEESRAADDTGAKSRLATKGVPSQAHAQGSVTPFAGSSTNISTILDWLQLPIEEQAVCHLLSNYVLIPSFGSAQGYMEFLVPLKKTGCVPLHFEYAFDACALASFNNRVSRNDAIEKKALSKYTKSLRALSCALRDPTAAGQEAILASTLLCGLFEVLRGIGENTESWDYHVEGAIQLVKDIGRENLLLTDVGQAMFAMFAMVRLQMLVQSVNYFIGLRATKQLDMGIDWWIDDTVGDKHALDCQRLMMIVMETRAEAERILASSAPTSKLDAMIERCRANDIACLEWACGLPDYYQYYTVARVENVPDGDYTRAEVLAKRAIWKGGKSH
ncbi:hypothetical protein HIM_08266 [Hirsutella minnesotensis 3608]|uniref:Zn(2)-C6 fungal-type domain-containing protein n=1 Tax=Hirsutella minnesotensis 3608 TaxID=1043627 RepID=A0A0F7ZMP1_9HYPO|nr:hypothetical protein HIM_08266 [Hirsutella minnesotensis 3608]